MKNTVIISDAAAADISAQFDYIRRVKREPANAERWLRSVYAAVEGLEDFAGYARAPESDFLDAKSGSRRSRRRIDDGFWSEPQVGGV